MELRHLVRETRGLGQGALTRAGTPFLLEEGRLMHETQQVPTGATRIIPPKKLTDDAAELGEDLARRPVYLVSRRDGKQGEITIGRGKCDIIVDASSVSSVHAVLAKDPA